MTDKQPDAGDRFISLVIDQILMMLIGCVALLPDFAYTLVRFIQHSDKAGSVPPDFFGGPAWYVSLLGMALYFCKDSLNGRSIGKRVTGLQVVNNITGLRADPIRCVIRNITAVIWPVEVLIAAFQPGRRLGDKIAGTRIAEYDDKAEPTVNNAGQIIIAYLLSYVLVFAVTSPLILFQKWVDKKARPPYVESSYNNYESRDLKGMLTDSLGRYMTPSIRVYDRTYDDTLKYISAVLKCDASYCGDKDTVLMVEERVKEIIYSQYPIYKFRGLAKYKFDSACEEVNMEMAIGRGDKTAPDKKMSAEIEQLLIDRMGDEFTPHVRITEKNVDEPRKVITLTLDMKKEYQMDDPALEALSDRAERLIYARYPKESFEGKIEWVYEHAGMKKRRSFYIRHV